MRISWKSLSFGIFFISLFLFLCFFVFLTANASSEETNQFRPTWDIYRSGQLYWMVKGKLFFTGSYGEKSEDVRVIEGLDTVSGKSLWMIKLGKGEYDKSICCTVRYLLVNTEKQVRVLEPATGKELWTIRAESKKDIYLAVCGERMYAVLRPGFLSAIDLDNRKVLWEVDFLKGSTLEEREWSYFGNVCFTGQGSIILEITAKEKIFFCMFEPASGRCLWKSPLMSSASSFVYDGRNLILKHRDRIISLEPGSWRRVWACDDIKPFESEMVSSGNMLYVVDSNGFLLALRSSDGKLCWSRQLQGAENFSLTAPAVSGGPVIAVSEGIVSAFCYSGELLWQLSPGLGEEIEILPVKTSKKPHIPVKSSFKDRGITSYIMDGAPEIQSTKEEKRRKADEIVSRIEYLTPLKEKELLATGDEGFETLFAAMKKILLEADRVIQALDEQAGKKESCGSFGDDYDLHMKKKNKSGLYSESYHAISDLIFKMASHRYTEKFFALLDELRTDEARAPVLFLLAEFGEGKGKKTCSWI